VLEKKEVFRDGKKVQLVRVAALGRPTAKTKVGYSSSEITTISKEVRQLDFLFLVDATDSMGKWIDSTKTAIETFVRSLGSKDDIKFALCVYRDWDDGEAIFQEVTPLTDVETFLRHLRNVRVFGGGDEDEAGFNGAMQAMSVTRFRNRSTRILAVVGDAAWHTKETSPKSNPRGYTVDTVVAAAKKNDVKIFAFSVGNDVPRRDKQFTEISVSTGGKMNRIGNISGMKAEVQKLLQDNRQEVQLMSQVVTGFIEGKSIDAIVEETGQSKRQITYIAELLEIRGIDLERLGPQGETGIDGWLVLDEEAEALEFFLTRLEMNQIQTLVREIAFVEKGVDIGVKLRDAGLGSRSPDFTFAQRLDAAFLPHCGSSILKLSPRQLMSLSEADRNRVKDAAAEIANRLDTALRDNRNWHHTPDGVTRGWVPESCLP